MPLPQIIAMSPLARSGSPWSDGDILFLSPEGRVWPYQPGSSRQANWLTLLCGGPGSGKSVAMNAINLSTAVNCSIKGRVSRLPRIGILDIGGSSFGFSALLKESMPTDRKHEVAYLDLALAGTNAVNVFDTMAGMRFPLPSERGFLINFLSLLCGTVGDASARPPPGLIAAVLDQAYLFRSDQHDPRMHANEEEPMVDRALADAGIQVRSDRSWWEVADLLYSAGRFEAGSIAQSRAVPLLADLVAATHAEAVRAMYSETIIQSTGEPALSAFARCVSEAVRDFPALSGSTRMVLSDVRVAVLNLLAPDHAYPGAAAILFMLGRQLVTRGWFVAETDIHALYEKGALTVECRDHHLDRILQEQGSPKLLCIDEFHRAANIPELAAQVLRDTREGRKSNVRISLASQFLTDFGSSLVEVASSIFLFGRLAFERLEEFSCHLELDADEVADICGRTYGRKASGSSFFAIIRHQLGVCRVRLFLPLPAAELWAHATSAEDVALRRMIISKLGASEGCAALAARYPRGTIRELRKVGEDLTHHDQMACVAQSVIESYRNQDREPIRTRLEI